jgi:hypothetical protein
MYLMWLWKIENMGSRIVESYGVIERTGKDDV